MVDGPATFGRTSRVIPGRAWLPAPTLSELASGTAGVNGSFHTCFNECDNLTASLWTIYDAPRETYGYNCTTRCFLTTCIEDCFGNCTEEAAYAAVPARERHAR